MRVFCYFIEPADYTLDLVRNIHDQMNIDYAFLYSFSIAESSSTTSKLFLDKLSWLERIKYIIKKFFDNDLIIVNGYNNLPFLLSFILNLFFVRKRFIAIESDTQLSIPNFFLKRLFKYLYLSFIFKNPNTLGFAGGNYSHKDLFSHYGMHKERIFLMPMMVDNNKFYYIKRDFSRPFNFLYVGRILRHKNIEVLINQFIKNFSDKSASLRIVGDGKQLSYLKNKYQANNIKFVGSLFGKELINEFHLASCLVLPSLFEPWGLVVNEALSSGLPAVVSEKVGANFDLIDGRNTGLIACNDSQIGKSMLRLYSDKILLKSYSINAHKLMSEYWNYDLYSKCLRSVLANLNKTTNI